MRDSRHALVLLVCLVPACSGDSTGTTTPEPVPTAVTIRPDSALLVSTADTIQFEAEVLDQHGQAMVDAELVWSALDADLVGVGPSGRAWAKALGEHQARVRAAHANVADTATAAVRISRCSAPPPAGSPPGADPGVPAFQFIQARDEQWPYPETFPWMSGIDIHGDGRGDAVLVAAQMNATENEDNPGGAVLLLVDDGAGGYQRDSLPVDPDRISSPGDVIVLDADGDGLEDAFLPQFGPDAPQTIDPTRFGSPDLLLAQSGGTMIDVSSRLDPLERRPTNIFANTAADIDCDGDLDLYSGGQPGRLYVNDGVGGLEADDGRTPSDVSGERNAAVNYQGAAFCDVDRDGAPDLLLTSDGMTEPERLLLNDGFGRFSDAPDGAFPLLPSQNISREYIVCADFDRDGWNDFVLGEANPEIEIRFIHNQGDGTFAEKSAEWLPPGAVRNPGDIEVADLNGDGWPDLLAACDLLINTGTGLVHHGLEGYLEEPYRCFNDQGLNQFSLAIPLPQPDGTVDILFNTSPPVILRQ